MARIKLTLLGGGGVRAPLFVSSALRRAPRIGLDEISLLDVDEGRLRIFEALSRALTRGASSPVRITATTNAREALEGAHYVIPTIRVGGDHGRALDERIALRHGVLGQETTGPGGFAMALRSIPAILRYAEMIEEVSPGAWILNFTNPAGLVVQALRDHGFTRTVGICDSANAAQRAAAARLQVDAARLQADVFGLNHLSWTRRVLLDGHDVLPRLLRDPAVIAGTLLRFFDRPLIAQMGMWLNEYLYYYYYAERAREAVVEGGRTRGEEIEELNEDLIKRLGTLVDTDPPAALHAYDAYQRRRDATYMRYAESEPTPPAATSEGPHTTTINGDSEGDAHEGYAGVALDIMEAFASDRPLYTALNVPNEGAIACMRPDDVVEVSCVVDRDGVRPQAIGEIPEPQALLIRAVKLYERLTVQAIRDRSRQTAVAALMAHPLVLSYSLARPLVDEYLTAHAPYVGTWG